MIANIVESAEKIVSLHDQIGILSIDTVPSVGPIIRVSLHGTDMVHDLVLPFSRNIMTGKNDGQILPHWIPRSTLLPNPIADRF